MPNFFVALVFVVAVCAGCQSKNDRDAAVTPESPSGDGLPPVAVGEESPPTGQQIPLGKIPPLKLFVQLTFEKSFYAQHVEPVLAASCAVNGCHAKSEVIDLRVFPFEAAGSYTMDDIVRDMGPAPAAGAVQLRVVQVLIDSMRAAYMPPAWSEVPAVSSEQILLFETWLQKELSTESPAISGTIEIAGEANAKAVCQFSFIVSASEFATVLEIDRCRTADKMTFQFMSDNGQLVSKSAIEFSALIKLTQWIVKL